MKHYLYISESNDVYFNQAVEKTLFLNCPKDGLTVYLWANEHTVVIGKNQSAHAELKVGLFSDEGGSLARRISGGGAVYHDVNNLNFTFVAPDCLYDKSNQFGLIVDAVNSFGLNAYLSGRNDIEIEGRKFSGNAFYRSNGVSLHHGTILINTDLTKITRYLTVDRSKFESKGVASVAARVVNLCQMRPSLDRQAVTEAIVGQLKGRGGCRDIDVSAYDGEIKKYRAEFADRDWTVGKSPSYTVTKRARFSWGCAEVGYELLHGVIADVSVFTDSLEYEFFERLPALLIGRSPESLARVRFDGLSALEQAVTDDVVALICSPE